MRISLSEFLGLSWGLLYLSKWSVLNMTILSPYVCRSRRNCTWSRKAGVHETFILSYWSSSWCCSVNFLIKRCLQALFRHLCCQSVFHIGHLKAFLWKIFCFSLWAQWMTCGDLNFDVLLYMAISICSKQRQMVLMGLSHFRFLMRQQGNYRVLLCIG